MSTTLTYPGVYIQELPSGQHIITGVATSIAAFIGWSNQGPVGEAVMVESAPEYNTLFGGMIPGVPLGYAVNQFFQNGGSQAYIVRLYETTTSTTAPVTTAAATAANTIGGLPIVANNPGAWANALCVTVSNVLPASGGNSTFNLQVLMLTPSGTPALLENYTNLSTDPTNPQWAVTVINSDSTNITITAPTPPGTSLPTPTATANVWIAAGSLTTPTQFFTATETVTQAGSGATAKVVGTVNGSYLILSALVSGTPNSSGAWTDTAGASFSPTTAPVKGSGTPLAVDGPLPAGATAGIDGTILVPNQAPFETQLTNATTGYQLLGNVSIFNLLCVPGENSAAIAGDMQHFCWQNRAFLIVDAAQTAVVGTGSTGLSNTGPADSIGATLVDQYAGNSAFYFPWVSAPDPSAGFRPTLFPPCGFVAGIYASTDATRGVWKAPAGIDASLTGALGLQYVLTDMQNGLLNPLAVNCLRQFPNFGNVVWGARTIAGNDALGSQWKYVSIRRLALFIESSLYAGTQWAVFEPNAEPLWGQVRLSIGTFLQGLFLQGAFAGTTPQQAYFVKCDDESNTDATTALGIQRHRRLCAPVSGRVRGHPNPADDESELAHVPIRLDREHAPESFM
jgi:Bacteriophage tail sheath protein